MPDSTEDDNKVDVEEAIVNLSCIKNELTEENLHVTQYRLALGLVFSERNFEDDDNLIGFLDNDAIMENVIIKLESIKKEVGNVNYCNECNGDYTGYCLKCSTLSHILNNASPYTSLESEINTMPIDILEIRDTSVGKGIFLLKTLPKNIIFGPFEGISAVKIAKGHGWKINNKRIDNVENGNWMKDIACGTSDSIKNLDVFQMKGNLYFQTNREIMEGEELLVYYDDKIQKSDNSQECHFIPRKQESLGKIYACTFCCLGFQLVKCLREHKMKCPHGKHCTNIKDFELIKCHCCEIWLETKEHQEYHMGYCWEKYLRMSCDHSEPVNWNEVNVEIIDRPNTEKIREEFICSQCSYETSCEKNFRKHLSTHEKPFQCEICMVNFIRKAYLKKHIVYKHVKNGSAKKYQCSDCSYQTNYKHTFDAHLNRHRGIKPFQCDVCKMKYTTKVELKYHIKNKHTDIGGKDYHCSECVYETNYKSALQIHLNSHRGIKPFECSICKLKLSNKKILKIHIKNKHTAREIAKKYQCSNCSYQTNYKHYFQYHLNNHRGIKPYECDICKTKFVQKYVLNSHIRNKHTEKICAKNYKCSECTFETKYKFNYQAHLNSHRGIKPFKCDTCNMKFTLKGTLATHIKNKHTENGCAKRYQCSECTYQTNYKREYQDHINRHRGIKPFECDICKKKFHQRNGLRKHIKNKHTKKSS